MTTTTRRRRSHRLRAVLVLAGIAGCVAAVPLAAVSAEAAGPTATSTAQALKARLAVVDLSTAPASASSDGQVVDDSGLVGAAVGGAGNTGVAAAQARASSTGVAACSALLGRGGTLTVGSDGTCTTTAGTGGVLVGLTPLLRLRADAIVASCSVTAPGEVPTARVELTGAKLEVLSALGAVTSTTALSSAGTVTLPKGLGTVIVSDTTQAPSTSTSDARASATALTIRLAGLADVVVASADCGVPTFLLPALPLQGAPVAAGVLGVSALATRRWWLPAARLVASGRAGA